MPWLAGLSAAVVLAAGLYLAFAAPQDYQQGTTVRIMYIHVPFAWLSMFCYTIMAAGGARHAGLAPSAGRRLGQGRGADRRGVHGAGAGHRLDLGQADVGHMVGVGRPPHLGLRAVPDVSRHHRAEARDGGSGAVGRAVAIITLVGFINIPIIKFSVDWWNTLHQPASVFRLDGPTIHPSLLWPLLVMALGFTLLFLTLHLDGDAHGNPAPPGRGDAAHRGARAPSAEAA